MNLNIIKKVAAFALTGTMILSLAACGSTKDSKTEDSSSAKAESKQDVKDNSLCGWEVNNGKLSLEENAEAKAAFEKATEGLTGYEYEPIALLGTQIVSGRNYSILARGKAVVPDAEPSYEIITIYEDLEGNAKIPGEKVLVGGEGEKAVGAFTANDGEYDFSKNAEVKAIFDKAFDGFVGASYEAVAYLGSQVVAGTNYLALFRETPTVPDAEPSFVLVTVYEDLKGNTKVLGMDEVLFGTKNDVPSSENVQIPDPFEGFSTLEQAVKVAGFEISVPDAPKGYETAIYRVNTGTKMLEVIYSDKDLESEDAVEAYRIRKAIGSDDISGDYNDYSEKTEVSVSGNQVSLKGNDGKVFVSTWTSGEFTYAIDIDMDGQGLSGDEVIALVNATK